ncbi:hypothetical protein [Herbiconiux ginsengi]|uniref:Bacterial Ig-like domain-containing protein n=1 Tax=Herbiconiux ginsengi TaxID=381665 RepID=A0A1H3SE02_9MICO|nr:hypothetical protein [Herbiconiux ginsengi]SDZ35329.1 hypothetical protein SAMN05216554_3470 [Herbiconiux ginsengi]
MSSRKEWGGTASQLRDAGESRSRNRVPHLVVATLAAAFLVAGGLGFGAGVPAASAAPETTPSPAPTASAVPSEPAPPPSAPLPSNDPTDPPDATTPPPTPVAPDILSPAEDALVSSPVEITGTGTPGGSLQILVAGSSEPLCVVTPDADGAWSCTATGLPSSSSTTLRAVEPAAGGSAPDDTVSLRVLNAPTVTGGPRGTLTNAVVQGSAVPGATVTATAGAFACSGTADASGAWSCALADGITDGDYVVTARQTTPWSNGASSPASEPLGIQVDVTVPPAPQLLSPSSGQALPTSGALFSGSGEDGATVSIFAGAYSLCQVLVSGTTWSCSAAPVPAGRYPVAVLQQDPAGNVSVQSGPLTLVFQDATATAPGTPGGTGSSATPPATSGGQPGSPDASAPSGGGSGSSGSPGFPPGNGSGDPTAPGQDGTPAPGVVPPSGSWSDATRFTASLQPAVGVGAGPVWWIALAVGGLALLLVALPARLLAGTMETVAARDGAERGRTPLGGRMLAALLGRNRSRHEYDRAPELRISPIATAGAAVLAAAAIVTLSAPVENQPAYLRLFVAVVAALGLVNLIATVVPARVASLAFGISSSVRLRPGLLLVAAGLALVSRLADLEPSLVFGLVAGLVIADSGSPDSAPSRSTDPTPAAVRSGAASKAIGPAAPDAWGRLATVQVLALGVLGAVAWLAAGALGDQTGSTDILMAGYAEFLHVVVLASFGATSLLLLPIGRSAGRRLLAWSPATWLLLAIASFSALAMLFVPSLAAAAEEGRLVVLLVGALAFAAVSVSAWAWTRFVADDAP